MKPLALLFLLGSALLGAEPVPASGPDDRNYEEIDATFRASFYYSSSVLAELQGHHAESLALLKRASESDPKSFYLLTELADAWELNERYAEEEAVLEKAVQINPASLEARQRLARVYVRLGKAQGARKLYAEPAA